MIEINNKMYFRNLFIKMMISKYREWECYEK